MISMFLIGFKCFLIIVFNIFLVIFRWKLEKFIKFLVKLGIYFK